MSGNTFGSRVTITTFGESHGKAIGVIMDGIPSNEPVDLEQIQRELDRRKPGTSRMSTARSESDRVQILSGILDGMTLGTSICMVIYNQDQRSKDYSALEHLFRPSHADLGYTKKYGIRDVRGGGRSSGRETAARVAAGALARQLLKRKGVSITAYTTEVAGISCTERDLSVIEQNDLRACDLAASRLMEQRVLQAIGEQDSCGGIVECLITGVPAGLGEPVFDKLDATLAHAMLSLGAVKGIEFGLGFAAARLTGSEHNDQFIDGSWENRSGGILGGISTGEPIMFRVPVKPTPSISRSQKTLDDQGRETTIEISGRHDPCICGRIVPVIEAMSALVLLDAWLLQFGSL